MLSVVQSHLVVLGHTPRRCLLQLKKHIYIMRTIITGNYGSRDFDCCYESDNTTNYTYTHYGKRFAIWRFNDQHSMKHLFGQIG